MKKITISFVMVASLLFGVTIAIAILTSDLSTSTKVLGAGGSISGFLLVCAVLVQKERE